MRHRIAASARRAVVRQRRERDRARRACLHELTTKKTKSLTHHRILEARRQARQLCIRTLVRSACNLWNKHDQYTQSKAVWVPELHSMLQLLPWAIVLPQLPSALFSGVTVSAEQLRPANASNK